MTEDWNQLILRGARLTPKTPEHAQRDFFDGLSRVIGEIQEFLHKLGRETEVHDHIEKNGTWEIKVTYSGKVEMHFAISVQGTDVLFTDLREPSPTVIPGGLAADYPARNLQKALAWFYLRSLEKVRMPARVEGANFGVD
jgi:hypothetical protein